MVNNLLKDVVVPIFAIGGALIVIWNFVTALVERCRDQRRKDDDDLRFIKWCHDEQGVSTSLVYIPSVGSEDYLWAERIPPTLVRLAIRATCQ